MHACVRTQPKTHRHACSHAHTHTYTRIHTHTHTHINTHVSSFVTMLSLFSLAFFLFVVSPTTAAFSAIQLHPLFKHALMTYTHTRENTHTHTHTHTHIHTHVPSFVTMLSLFSLAFFLFVVSPTTAAFSAIQLHPLFKHALMTYTHTRENTHTHTHTHTHNHTMIIIMMAFHVTGCCLSSSWRVHRIWVRGEDVLVVSQTLWRWVEGGGGGAGWFPRDLFVHRYLWPGMSQLCVLKTSVNLFPPKKPST